MFPYLLLPKNASDDWLIDWLKSMTVLNETKGNPSADEEEGGVLLRSRHLT